MASNDERKLNVVQIIGQLEPDFNKLAAIHGAVNFEKERAFAHQVLQDNAFLYSTAMADQDSLKRAILNVAIIGLSLSPVHKLAYLIPRNKKICLDLSYRGIVQLALDIGAVRWVKAELVHGKDTFKFVGTNKEPIHEFDPFGDRGAPVGVYCLAKSHDGDFYFDHMTADQVISIRDRSESYKAFVAKGVTTPWETDFEEMVKKTMIRRASKSWPMRDTRSSARFAEAIDVTNDIDFSAQAQIAPPKENETNVREAKVLTMRSLLAEMGREEANFITHCGRVFRREIKTLEELTENETSQAITMLNQFLEIKKASDAKKAELAKKETA